MQMILLFEKHNGGEWRVVERYDTIESAQGYGEGFISWTDSSSVGDGFVMYGDDMFGVYRILRWDIPSVLPIQVILHVLVAAVQWQRMEIEYTYGLSNVARNLSHAEYFARLLAAAARWLLMLDDRYRARGIGALAA